MTYLCYAYDLLTCFFLVNKLSVRYYGKDKEELGTARLYLTAVGKFNHTKFTRIIARIILSTFNVFFFLQGCELLTCFYFYFIFCI